MPVRIEQISDLASVIEAASSLATDARDLEPKGFGRDLKLGYVYVLEGPKYVKIGCTMRPKERLKELRTSERAFKTREYVSPPLLAYFRTEQALHKALRSYRVSGEWFRLSFDQAKEIVEGACEALVLPDEEVNRLLAGQKKAKETRADEALNMVRNKFITTPAHDSESDPLVDSTESRLNALEDAVIQLSCVITALAYTTGMSPNPSVERHESEEILRQLDFAAEIIGGISDRAHEREEARERDRRYPPTGSIAQSIRDTLNTRLR